MGQKLICWNYIFLVELVFGTGEKTIVRYNNVPNGITWPDAVHKCGENGLEYDIDILKRTISSNDMFWIGKAVYRQLSPWMEIKGCYQVYNDTIKEPNSSIGLCKRSCNITLYIGFKDPTKECVCLSQTLLDELPKQVSSRCTTSELSDTFFVYKEFKDNISSPALDGNCLTVCCGSCNDKPSGIIQRNCSTKSDSIATTCQPRNNANVQPWLLNQTEGNKFCNSKNSFLLNATYCQENQNQQGIEFWTNVFRQEFEMCSIFDQTLQPLRCLAGVINITDKNKNMIITEKDCSTNIHIFVCRGEMNQSLVETLRDEGNKRQTTGLIIGIVVGLVIAVGAIIALVLFRIRSSSPSRKDKKIANVSSNKNYTDTQILNHEDQRQSINNPGYTFCQIGSENTRTPSPVNGNESECIYTVSRDDEYDKLNNVGKRKVRGIENTYDSNVGVKQLCDPTYDSAIQRTRPSSGEDIYNHAS